VVGEPHRVRDLADRLLAAEGQESLRTVDAKRSLVAMRRQAVRAAEGAHEMRGRERGDRRQTRQRDRLGRVLVQILAGGPERGSGRRPPRVGLLGAGERHEEVSQCHVCLEPLARRPEAGECATGGCAVDDETLTRRRALRREVRHKARRWPMPILRILRRVRLTRRDHGERAAWKDDPAPAHRIAPGAAHIEAPLPVLVHMGRASGRRAWGIAVALDEHVAGQLRNHRLDIAAVRVQKVASRGSTPRMTELTEVVAGLRAVSLEELDERASLLRRVDNKYAVPRRAFLELVERLRADHDVLEINACRQFDYATVYFETRDLRCFRDHVESREPRFKARTRLYRDTEDCVFEVKLKCGDGETDKRQAKHPADQAEELTESALRCLHDAPDGAGIELHDRLAPALHTGFRRITLATREQSARLTCDIGIRLTSHDGKSVAMQDDLVLVETKSEDGESPADRALAELGAEQISLSKYRVGMSLVGGAPTEEPQPGSEYFAGS